MRCPTLPNVEGGRGTRAGKPRVEGSGGWRRLKPPEVQPLSPSGAMVTYGGASSAEGGEFSQHTVFSTRRLFFYNKYE